MTKVELVDRIMIVTGWEDVTLPSSVSIKRTIMDCVDAFSETLLSRVKLEVEQAVHTAVTNALDHVKAEGRGEE